MVGGRSGAVATTGRSKNWVVAPPRLSLAVTATCWLPTWLATGVQVKSPVAGSIFMPAGALSWSRKVIGSPSASWARTWYWYGTRTTADPRGVEVITGVVLARRTVTWNDWR